MMRFEASIQNTLLVGDRIQYNKEAHHDIDGDEQQPALVISTLQHYNIYSSADDRPAYSLCTSDAGH